MYRIACYYRVSKYTGVEDESQSIKNQRILIHKFIDCDCEINKYIREKKITKAKCIEEYIDDGYSGKNIERPALTRLINDVILEKIDIIIVKDFSRFSRDYIYMGEFLEYIITTTYVRFISINDDYDSKRISVRTSVDEAFKHIVYDYYSIDNSYKIKKGLENSRKRGRYIASKAIYGYKRVNGYIVIDEEESKIVKLIYGSYDRGMKVKDIVIMLNEMSITDNRWNKNKVYRILREEQYTGVMIYGRRKVLDVASHKRISNKKDEWKIIDNHHEPIIDKDFFTRVRKKIEKSVYNLKGE